MIVVFQITNTIFFSLLVLSGRKVYWKNRMMVVNWFVMQVHGISIRTAMFGNIIKVEKQIFFSIFLFC